uniref:HA2 domain-containing protein n=1 Tax=Ascaris lumbricoides TaxID=6252 RepID=A0A0M3IGK9_ASCLU
MNSQDQQKVFDPVPVGCRKVVADSCSIAIDKNFMVNRVISWYYTNANSIQTDKKKMKSEQTTKMEDRKLFALEGHFAFTSFLPTSILSTNIAEASLTIDDVVFVVDCGKVKEKTYDHSTRINQLKMAWIAKSNAEQRAGRAGRCRAGYCFRLYSVDDYDRMNPTQASFHLLHLFFCSHCCFTQVVSSQGGNFQVAEMKRAAIHDVCLHAKMFAPENMSVKKFLSLAPEPPSPQAVEWSLEFLEASYSYFRYRYETRRHIYMHVFQQLGALYGDRSATAAYEGRFSVYGRERREPDLTELGRHIAQLPLEPQLARLLLFGIALRCFNPVVTL